MNAANPILPLPITLTALAWAITASCAPAQEALPDSLGTARPAHTATGSVRAQWVTSEDETPLAGGTFTLRWDGERGILDMELRGMGRFVFADDGEGGWCLDPAAGPALLAGGPRTAQRRLLGLLGGAAWGDLYERAKPGQERAFEMLPPIDGARTADRWILDPAGAQLARARLTLVDGIGEAHEVTVDLTGEPVGTGTLAGPGRIVLTRGHHQFVLDVAERKRGAGSAKAFAAPADVRKAAELLRAAAAAGEFRAPQTRIEQVQEVHTASVRRRVKMAEIGRVLGGMYAEVMAQVRKEGASVVGAPFSRYHTRPDASGEVDLEAGMPVSKPIEGNDRVRPNSLPAGRVASTWHVGPYHELGRTYERLTGWLKQEGLTPNGPSWEIYWTDPGMQPDPKRWRTQVVMPVR